ncbi:NAD(P)/FAD-dependent oxidoreductase [Naasia aerilata]|uniref:Pyridine nucleotide-disulfide oxidoreductase n=1 Tax=Naasia aerilata TaxID=1162966 RepID=A0ABM8GAG0_9MICO|nr:FAD-dependent oxidoreductase [Naasia aerilata]BDZ45201.1 pyridine nucleotide-disulfide oxidoreductase [Naasia aerilata]
MSDPVVIVGASLGGLRTAEALRRSGYAGPVTVFGDEPHAPYNRPPLSKDVLAGGEVTHAAVAFPQRAATADVLWRLGTRIGSADLERRRVRTADGEEVGYRALVVATGLRPKRLFPRTAALAGAFALRTLDDAGELSAALTPGTRVVIAGSGFVGCEVAATARQLGCEVTVVGSSGLPMLGPLGEALAEDLMERHEQRGVSFHMGTHVAEVIGRDLVEGVRLADGSELACQVLVEAIGSVHNTEWLSGNDVDADLGLRTDSAMRVLRVDGSPWPDVFAVGDVARFPNAIYGDTPASIEHWNIPTETAKRAGRVLALQLAGDPGLADAVAERFAPIPSFWSDQYDIRLLAYGLPALADRVELLAGRRGEDCVYGYFVGAELVGVCGIGMRSEVMRHRDEVSRYGQLPIGETD